MMVQAISNPRSTATPAPRLRAAAPVNVSEPLGGLPAEVTAFVSKLAYIQDVMPLLEQLAKEGHRE